MVKTKVKVSTFSATPRDLEMLEVVARYHGLNKSATHRQPGSQGVLARLSRRHRQIRPDRGAKVESK